MNRAIEIISASLNDIYPKDEIEGFKRIIVEYISKKTYRVAIIESESFNSTQIEKVEEIVKRLTTDEPIQYILGETEFFGLPFYVNKHTLIPRPETEELVELILNENQAQNLSVLDIGTGSGCIAIALKKNMDEASVSGWDISDNALTTAIRNATSNGTSINFSQVDILVQYPNNKKFDIIVSNPPYVTESEKMTMDKNVLDYEPHTALFVSDNNPLIFYERIADTALNLLKTRGKLYFEINRAKGNEVVKLLEEVGFANVTLLKDMSGNDRMVKAELAN